MSHHAGEAPANGPQDALALLREWDPAWAETCRAMSANPWTNGVLPRRTVELIGVAVNAACTNLDPAGMRRHIRAAPQLGATVEEVMDVLKLCVVQGVQTCNPGVPILAQALAEITKENAVHGT